jgi:hypothetical protein
MDPWVYFYALERKSCRVEKISTAPTTGTNTHPAFASGARGGLFLWLLLFWAEPFWFWAYASVGRIKAATKARSVVDDFRMKFPHLIGDPMFLKENLGKGGLFMPGGNLP